MINYSRIIKNLGFQPRLEQELTYDALKSALACTGKVSLFQADTGVGKTAAIALAALNLMKDNNDSKISTQVIIATTTVTLAKEMNSQIQNICDALGQELQGVTLGLLIGSSHYISPERVATAVKSQQNCSEQDLSLLEHLYQWHDTIDEFIATYGQLPFSLNPSAICQTRNSKLDNWGEIKDSERLSDIVITTHSMISIDMKKKRTIFNDNCNAYLLVDEADQFIDMLKSQANTRLNLKRLYSEVYSNDMPPKIKRAFELAVSECELSANGEEFNYSSEARTDAINLVRGLIESTAEQQDNEFAELHEYLQFWMLRHAISPYLGTGVSKVNKEAAIVAVEPYSSRKFGSYALANYKSVALLSGTLSIDENVESGVKWCIKDLGLTKTIGKIFEFSPSRFGAISISLCDNAKEKMYLSKKDAVLNPLWIKEQCMHIYNTGTGRALILTASHKESELFALYLGGSAIMHKKGDKLNVSVEQFKTHKTKQYLITAAGHTGLNLKDDNGKMMISDVYITRIGFPPPNEHLRSIAEIYEDDRYQILQRIEHFSSMISVTRKIKQSIGRGIRGENDKIHFCILDHRFPLANNFGQMKMLKNSIPKRFSREYANATVLNHEEQEIII